MWSSFRHSTQRSVTVVSTHAAVRDAKTLRRIASDRRQVRLTREERIDEELAQSFPASDPPSWVSGATR